MSEFVASVPSVLLFALSSFRFRAVCVAVLMGLLASLVLLTFPSPKSVGVSASIVFNEVADNAVGVEAEPEIFPRTVLFAMLFNPRVTDPEVPPPTKPVPAVTPVILPVPDPLPLPVADKTPATNERPDPIEIDSGLPFPVLVRPISELDAMSAIFEYVIALSATDNSELEVPLPVKVASCDTVEEPLPPDETFASTYVLTAFSLGYLMSEFDASVPSVLLFALSSLRSNAGLGRCTDWLVQIRCVINVIQPYVRL